MEPFNHSYGSLAILRAHCGVESRHYLIPGYLQHGWTAFKPIGPRSWYPEVFVWSRRALERCKELGIHRVTAIGAPFLYLRDIEPARASGDRSLLAMPFHGWEQSMVKDAYQSYEAYCRELTAVRDRFDRVTVSLHFIEYQRKEFRALFESQGFRVVSFGDRYDETFLSQLKRELHCNAFVTSNRVSTAIFYAAYCGCRTFIMGPAMSLEENSGSDIDDFSKWQARNFPEMIFPRIPDSPLTELARRELGTEFIMTPEQMRKAFGWNLPPRLSYLRSYYLNHPSAANIAKKLLMNGLRKTVAPLRRAGRSR